MDRISRFLTVQQRGDKTVLFNILKGDIAFTSGRLFDSLRQGAVANLPIRLKSAMLKMGMLVGDGDSEREFIYREYAKHKAGGSVLCLTLTPSYRCNCACPACFQKGYDRRVEMDTTISGAVVALIKRLIETKQPAAIVLWLYGGEPFLFAEKSIRLLDSIRTVCQNEKILNYVYCTTNGTLLDSDSSRQLSNHIDHFYLSMCQSRPDQGLNRPFKNGKNSYAAMLRGCRYLAEQNKQMTLRFNISDLTTLKRDLPIVFQDILDACGGKPHEKICFEFSALNQRVQHCLLDKETAQTHSDRDGRMNTHIRGLIQRLTLPWDSGHFKLPAAQKVISYNSHACGFEVCGYLKGNNYFISPDGSMYMCNITENDPDYLLGNVTDFEAALANEFYTKVQTFDLFADSECAACKYLPLCLRDCPLKIVKNGDGKRVNGCRKAKRELVQKQIDLLWDNWQRENFTNRMKADANKNTFS